MYTCAYCTRSVGPRQVLLRHVTYYQEGRLKGNILSETPACPDCLEWLKIVPPNAVIAKRRPIIERLRALELERANRLSRAPEPLKDVKEPPSSEVALRLGTPPVVVVVKKKPAEAKPLIARLDVPEDGAQRPRNHRKTGKA